MAGEKPVKVLLNERLRAMRQACRLTQQQVADALGLDRSTYTYYECGRSQPNLDILSNICDIFNISLGELLELNGLPYAVDDSGNTSVPEAANEKLNGLSNEEQNLILAFRRLPAKQRKDIVTSIRAGMPAPTLPTRGRKRTKTDDN